MTREELIKILENKGFYRLCTLTERYRYEIHPYNMFDISVEIRDTTFDLIVNCDYRGIMSFCSNIEVIDFTEQKIDEILSQCNIIKTALDKIKQVARENNNDKIW